VVSKVYKYVCRECGERCELNTSTPLTDKWVGICWLVQEGEVPFEVPWEQVQKRGG